MEGQTVAISNIILGIAIILWSIILGMAIIAFGQLLLAFREMAHNTRKEGVHGPHYNILLVMAKVNNLLGWVMLAAGLAFGIYMLVAGHPIVLQTPAIATSTTI
ncbi:MAG: hypothetical protein PHI34_11485 [Acidobacteriota bacterium]|nr:hypothetical protein [Acidobacteriota bacterium]